MSPAHKKAALVTALLGALGFAGAVLADEKLAPERAAMILLRALSYDRSLADRAGDRRVVAVAIRNGDAESKAFGSGMLLGFKHYENLTIQDKPVSILKLSYDQTVDLERQLRGGKFAAVYFAGCLDASLPSVRDLTRSLHILSMTGCDVEVSKGLSLAVSAASEQATILLNLGASRREGADFSSDFSRRAKVVDF